MAALDESSTSLRPADPESTEPRERARAARRAALLETAESVFAERGFAGATMAEIASRAGYSAGNLYNVFEGKDALFEEVVATRGDEVLASVQDAIRGSDDLPQIIDAYVDASLRLVEERRGYFVLLGQTSPDFNWNSDRPKGDGTHLLNQLDAGLERLFQDAIDRGEIEPLAPRAYACVLHGTVNAHISSWIRNEGSREDLWGSASDLKRVLCKALGVEPAR